MDVNDFNSPLRGLLQSPIRRFTPAVPTPDWDNLDATAKSAVPPQPIAGASSSKSSQQTEDQKSAATPAVEKTSLSGSVIRAPINITSDGVLQSPDSKRHGAEAPMTPGAERSGVVNPHASLIALNPVVSGPEQVKQSIKIQNCVSTVNSDCTLDLLNIYSRTRFSEYNPSRFHGLIMRMREPKTTALVFRSGKMVCTGARTEYDSCLAVMKFIRLFEKLGFPVKMLDFKVHNFVATGDLRFPIRLEMLHHSHGQFSSYEPELFPGLVYRLVRPRMVLLIFVNGKMVFTGAKSRSDIDDALDLMYPILRSFKKN